MNTRLRGLLVFLLSTVLTIVMGFALFKWVNTATTRTRIPAAPFALPVVGMLWGLLELVTGRRFKELDAWYQKFPVWISYPVGCLAGIAMLVACVAWILWLLRRLGM